jgi:hypothetical protein
LLPTLITLGFDVLSLAGCGDSSTDPPSDENESDGRIFITNDEEELARRVTDINEDVPIDPPDGARGPGTAGVEAAGRPFSLELLSEIEPPSAGGEILQATSVAIKGDFAITSYNMRGAEYLGAIDVIEIRSGQNARLRSSATFEATDVNAVCLDNDWVYAAEATGDLSFEFPAILEAIRLEGGKLRLDENDRVTLTSYAGTGAYSTADRVYATSGDAGGLSVFDSASLTLVQSFPLHDARWAHVNGGRVVVAQGTPGQLSVFDEASLSLLNTFPFNGANVPESKTTVEPVGGKAFVAGGPQGVQIVSVMSGTLLGDVPRPDPASLGLDPSVVVTNAVTADDDLLFISNGEAGVYVAQADENFAASGSETPQDLTLLGQLRFDDLQSVNHVTFKSGKLVIASGLGGVKVVRVHD